MSGDKKLIIKRSNEVRIYEKDLVIKFNTEEDREKHLEERKKKKCGGI